MKIYFLGFGTSLILTILAYLAVTAHLVESVLLISGCALLQIGIQFVCFLRLGQKLGQEPGGKQGLVFDLWNMSFFLFTVLIAVVIVVGSLWIMYNLNYRM